MILSNSPQGQESPSPLLLRHHLSPGDVLVMTAAVESLHGQYPGQYRTAVDTTCMPIWDNNLLVSPPTPADRVIELHYPAIHQSHQLRTGHFMAAFCSYLGEQLGIPLPLSVQRPTLCLATEERAKPPVIGPYMVVVAGTKRDVTCKAWGHANYQKVVDLTKDVVGWVQVGEARHSHRPLDGVVNLVGQTTPRDLFRLCHHSVGGIGPTTFVQHVMAALGRWYGCVLGGREPLSWCWYPTQTVFHTHGQLFCCRERACWKARVVPSGSGDRDACRLPVFGDEPIPACMDAILPEQVAAAVRTVVRHGASPAN